MVRRKFRFHDGEKGAALAVRIKQSRSDSCFLKVNKDGTVLIQLEIESGQINERLINFISEKLIVPQSKIQIIAGEDGSEKLISIIDMKPKEIQKRILDLIP